MASVHAVGGVRDAVVEHGKPEQLMAKLGLDSQGIANSIEARIRELDANLAKSSHM